MYRDRASLNYFILSLFFLAMLLALLVATTVLEQSKILSGVLPHAASVIALVPIYYSGFLD